MTDLNDRFFFCAISECPQWKLASGLWADRLSVLLDALRSSNYNVKSVTIKL